MDIVTVKARSKSSQKRLMQERRHTTEVRFDQLPSHTLSELERDSLTSLSQEDLSPRAEGYHHPVSGYPHISGGGADSTQLLNENLYKPTFKSSLGNIGPSHFKGSQGDLYQELAEHGGGSTLGVLAPDHQYQLSYDLAMDNMLTPFAVSHHPSVAPHPSGAFAASHRTVTSPLASPKKTLTTSMQKSLVSHIVEEVVTTEATYVHDLSAVIEGYVMPLQMRTTILPYDNNQLDGLFGNIVQIRDFHSAFLDQLTGGNASNMDDLGRCFLDRADPFKEVYTQYCNNYPNSIRVLAKLSKQSDISRFLKTCQQRLGHLLPLGAYLLKPVQRVLKYSLLLKQVVKATPTSMAGFSLMQAATVKMTEVAEHINSMKRKYDTAVHVQELQSLVRGNENLDLTKFGDLVLEDHFKCSSGKSSSSTFRGRTERYVFLFQRLYLVTKKEEVGYQYKMHVEMKDLQLTERVEKEPTSFQIRQMSCGRATTFQARTSQQKSGWVHKIKFLLVESIPHLSDRAKELIMRGFEVPRDPSPNREHQRHLTEESKSGLEGVVKGSGQEGLLGNQRSNSLGRNFSPQNTSPPKPLGFHGRHVSSPSGSKLQSSLTGILIATIHQPSSPRSESPREHILDHTHGFMDSPEQRDSGYSDTATGDPHRRAEGEEPRLEGEELPVTPDKSRTRRLFLRSTPELDHTPSHTPGRLHSPVATPPSRRSPVPQHHGPDHMQNGTDHMTSHMTGNNGTEHVISSPIFEDATENSSSLSQGKNSTEHAQYHSSAHIMPRHDNPNPALFSEHAQEVAPESGSRKRLVTDEEESLFNELMDSFGDKPSIFRKKASSTDLDWGDRSLRCALTPDDMQLLKEEHSPPRSDQSAELSSDAVSRHTLRGGSVDEESSTPRASPYSSPSTIRRWSIAKRRSYDISGSSDPEDSTPKASPFIRRHQSASAQMIVPPLPPPPANGEEVTFIGPILDPPTPFRTPFPVDTLQPYPDEDLELGHDSLEPSWSDQDTLLSSGQDSLPHGDQDPYNDQNTSNQDTLPSSNRDAILQDALLSSDQDGLRSSGSDLQLPVFDSPLRKQSVPKARTLPPNMSYEDMKAFMSVDKLQPVPANSVKRSRSFGNRSKVVHQRAGSLSTDNSPLPSPIFTKKGRGKEAKQSSSNPSLRHYHSYSTPRGSPAPSVAVVGLISTTRTTPELQDIPLIQFDPTLRPMVLAERGGTPLAGFEDERCNSRGSNASRESVEREDRSLLSFLRLKSRKGSRSNTPSMEEHKPDSDRDSYPSPIATPTTAPPTISMTVASNPSDMISFEDALDTCDRYASETGKTARSAKREVVVIEDVKAPSPDGKKKKGKRKTKKRHGYTVANIDADTMREVKRLTEGGGEGRRHKDSDSKVQQLAREYSHRIKVRSQDMRYSNVLEEPVPQVLYPVKPVWLSDLQDKRQYSVTAGRHNSVEDILGRSGDDDTSSTSASSISIGDDLPTGNGNQQAGRMRKSRTMDSSRNHGLLFNGVEFQEQAGEEDGQKKRRFKGWVKSLAAKFGKKEGTTL